jgi:hypothetical protein
MVTGIAKRTKRARRIDFLTLNEWPMDFQGVLNELIERLAGVVTDDILEFICRSLDSC